jgi:mannonate dehydratase
VEFDEVEAEKYSYCAGSHPVVRLEDGTVWDY